MLEGKGDARLQRGFLSICFFPVFPFQIQSVLTHSDDSDSFTYCCTQCRIPKTGPREDSVKQVHLITPKTRARMAQLPQEYNLGLFPALKMLVCLLFCQVCDHHKTERALNDSQRNKLKVATKRLLKIVNLRIL